MINIRYVNRTVIGLVVYIFSCSFAMGEENKNAFSEYVDEKGAISFPQNFRTQMVHLGAWFVPNGEASGFHDVFTEADSISYYKKHGVFPDGTILVKELRASNSGNFTTGQNVHYATPQLKQWFVMIKDSRNRFPDNTLWGGGWGWALFKPDDKGKNLAKNYKQDCLGCHLPARNTDLVYTQAYPALSE